jgi:hypothetical protein
MNNIQKRFLMFLIGCMGARTLLVILAKNIKKDYLPIMGYLALLLGCGFLFLYFTGYRDTGREVLGDKIWWNDLRPIHAILIISFSYLAINKSDKAWIVLLIDLLFGLTSFLLFHYNQGNFSKLK